MPPQLTPREHEILIASISEMDALPKIDFTKVAEKLGVAYPKNARSSFLKVWKKLGSADGSSLGDDENDGDASSAAVTPVKAPKKGTARKTPVKKVVGPAGPKKAGTPTRVKAAGKAKKEPEYGVKDVSEEVDLAAIQAYSGITDDDVEMDTKHENGFRHSETFGNSAIYGMNDSQGGFFGRAPTPGAQPYEA